jgi:LysM repeat protein
MKRIWIAGMLAAGIIIGGAANVTARQSHPTPFRGTTHVVQPGESLWTIAKEEYKDVDLREQIAEIKKANKLRSSSIVPGQRLLLPAP